ncbi:hypothetical protein [Rhizobium sp. BK376]|uniref:hypothetical protein n=1 Tax=Rhizobium sp. BK376 TaxID=2512149 RepID=UPI001052977D|nr:hypothetical protein [Rhizobium sp. BK376]TCR79569.1 hypothetical protein EV561_11567 [Rhizobium sp. BK376]
MRGPEDDEVIKSAAILIFRTEPEDPDTLRLLIQLFNAEEEVEYFRTFFEQRKELLSRALDASRTTVDRTSTKKAPVARRPTASSISITSVPSSPKKYPRTVIPRLALLPPNNAHRDPMVGILASSLIEDVTIGFCALNSLEVIAPHTAIQISNRLEEQPGTFKRYDINYVLDTRLSGADDNDISLFVQLIHPDNAEIIWAERYHLD